MKVKTKNQTSSWACAFEERLYRRRKVPLPCVTAQIVSIKHRCYIQTKVIRCYNKNYHKLCYNEQCYKDKDVVVYFCLVENFPFKSKKQKMDNYE